MWDAARLALGLALLAVMAQLAGAAVEVTLHEVAAALEGQGERVASPMVGALMRRHGVQYFDWNAERGEYGYWRDGRWHPAK